MTVLYSQRECPYSMRARMALMYAGMSFELRNIDSKNLPSELAAQRKKVKLPVLELADGRVLTDSLEIMHWALLQSDPDGWIDYEIDDLEEIQGLVTINDNSFVHDVMGYVFATENQDKSQKEYRKDCELFLAGLEQHLTKARFLFADRVSMADFAIFPFVYLFTQVRMEWFREALYPHVWQWFDYHQNSRLFKLVMEEKPLWCHGSNPLIYPQAFIQVKETVVSE